MALPKIIIVTKDKKFSLTAKGALEKSFDLTFASSGEKALKALGRDSRYTVIVSSMTLPGMDGREFLETAKNEYPKITRIMVTCTKDFDHAMELVNTTDISWLLTKPCDASKLRKAVTDSVRRYKKDKAESEAMRDTLIGCVKMLVDILELIYPEAVRRSKRIRRRAQQISHDLKALAPQFMDMVVLLSSIGCVGLPSDLCKRLEKGADITKEDMKTFRTHPNIAARLLENIPRMGKMAEIIRHQDTPCSKNPPMGARILKVCLDMDQMQINGTSPEKALKHMLKRPEIYDAKVVKAMARHRTACSKSQGVPLPLADLKPGMVMQEDMVSEQGAILLNRGESLSEASHIRLQAFSDLLKVREPIRVVMQGGVSCPTE